jgi:hypothetical protein
VSYPFMLEDVAFLRSPDGASALARAAGLALTETTRLSDVDTVRRMVGARFAPAVLETAVLRRRAASKVDGAGSWLFTGDALQQASASRVAAHRASRLAGLDVHDVTCSIGADLAALAGTARRAVGSDLDAVRLAMAAHNLRFSSAALVRADALHPISRDTVVFADPARRDSAGRRSWRPVDFTPPLDALATVYGGRPLVVKCAPGMDFALAPWACEVELVSLDGDVREACLWSAPLATAGVRRRATVLSSATRRWTVTDADPDDCPVRAPGEWLVNPDGAVVRAGLVRQYGARHGLGLLDERIAYLTGDAPPPGIRAFRVLEYGRYTEKQLRATLRRLDAGAVEILVRGLDVDPNALRPRLRLHGSVPFTVVLARIGRTPTAFVCRAHRWPPVAPLRATM